MKYAETTEQLKFRNLPRENLSGDDRPNFGIHYSCGISSAVVEAPSFIGIRESHPRRYYYPVADGDYAEIRH